MESYSWYQSIWQKKMDKSMLVAGMGESTRESYDRAMRKLVHQCGKDPERITEDELLDYFIFRQEENKWGADLPGFTAVLHTWGRQMQYHPHLHLIVPAGGLSVDRKLWLSSAKGFYLPVKALSKIFRAKFRTEMIQRKLINSVDPVVWKIDWNVNSQDVGDGEGSYKYLAPYVFRVAISDSRIVDVKNGEVTFSYRKKESNRPRHTTVDTFEFIRRFLQHVLPTGFMKVLHYGFMSSSCPISRAKLRFMVLNVLAALQGERVRLTDLAAPKNPKPPMPKPKCRLCGGVLQPDSWPTLSRIDLIRPGTSPCRKNSLSPKTPGRVSERYAQNQVSGHNLVPDETHDHDKSTDFTTGAKGNRRPSAQSFLRATHLSSSLRSNPLFKVKSA